MTLLFNSLQKNTLRFKVFASYCYLNNNKYVNSLNVHQISALDFPIRDFNKRTVFVCQEKKKKLHKNMNNFAFQELTKCLDRFFSSKITIEKYLNSYFMCMWSKIGCWNGLSRVEAVRTVWNVIRLATYRVLFFSSFLCKNF